MPSTSKIHWPPPAEPPRLRAGDVHLWCARLDAADDEAGRFEPWLSEDERQRARRLQFARDRQRFIAARGLLREILASYLATAAPEELRFAYGPAGKPRLAEPAAGTGLQFNLSHSGALALYAITWGEPVGVDLEAVRPMPELARIATQYFRPAESDLLRRLGPDRCLGTFFQLWTQKEALAKARGLGLAEALEPADAPVGPPHRPDHPWVTIRLQPAPGYTAAVALADIHPRLQCMQWITRLPAPTLRRPLASCG